MTLHAGNRVGDFIPTMHRASQRLLTKVATAWQARRQRNHVDRRMVQRPTIPPRCLLTPIRAFQIRSDLATRGRHDVAMLFLFVRLLLHAYSHRNPSSRASNVRIEWRLSRVLGPFERKFRGEVLRVRLDRPSKHRTDVRDPHAPSLSTRKRSFFPESFPMTSWRKGRRAPIDRSRHDCHALEGPDCLGSPFDCKNASYLRMR